MITFLSIQCLLPILYKHANIINSFHYIIGIYGQPPYNFLCVNMEIYRSRRKLFAPNPSRRAQLSPRTKLSLRSKSQPPRTVYPSHKAASADPLSFVRAGCFESPAPLFGRRWCVQRPESGRPSYSPTTSSPQSHISYPSSLPLHKTVRSVCTSLTPPLQIPYTNFLSLALPL